jgi:hypothetical protein
MSQTRRMSDLPPRALIAAPVRVVRELGSALEAEFDVAGGETFEEVEARLHEKRPAVLIVCYAFDEVRPFRFLNYLREEWRSGHIPTMLVRALPIPIGETEEAQIRESYKSLGVDVFFNLHDEARRSNRSAALEKFRDAVRQLRPLIGERRRDTARPADAASE